MSDNGNGDGGQSTHHEGDRQDQHTPNLHLQPADAVTDTAHLGQRAPTAPIPARIWSMYFRINSYVSLTFTSFLGQRNHCMRSQVSFTRSSAVFGHGGVIDEDPNPNLGRAVFPYPDRYIESTTGEQRPTLGALVKTVWKLKFHSAFVKTGISREWRVAEHELFAFTRPIYLVVGLFPRGHSNPQETIVFVHEPKHLFWKLSWAAFRLRGVSGTFLSLKHIKGFRLYKCHAETGLHERVDLDRNGVADLLLLRDAYKQWLVPRHSVTAWAKWIHQELNNDSHDVLEGAYSLELVLEWSSPRIIFVVFFPVLLSLAVGIWLNAKNWTDLATIQTAWGTASYIVTAGGLTAALLGILGSLPG